MCFIPFIQVWYLLLPHSPSVGPIHHGDFSRDLSPLHFAMDARLSWRTLPTLQRLLPFQQFVSEPQVWLNDDVQPPRPDKAVCSGE